MQCPCTYLHICLERRNQGLEETYLCLTHRRTVGTGVRWSLGYPHVWSNVVSATCQLTYEGTLQYLSQGFIGLYHCDSDLIVAQNLISKLARLFCSGFLQQTRGCARVNESLTNLGCLMYTKLDTLTPRSSPIYSISFLHSSVGVWTRLLILHLMPTNRY